MTKAGTVPARQPRLSLPVRLLGRVEREAAMLRRALIRRQSPVGDIASWLPPHLVVSPGGVGTTFLMEHCRRFVSLNDADDIDGLKHVPRVPEDWFEKSRILFVTGDAEAIYASLERRGYVREQAAKLGRPDGVLLPPMARKARLVEAIRAQIAFFTARGEENKALVVDYDDIWDRVEEIADWFGIGDPAFVSEFPARKQRKSSVAG